MKMDEKLFIRIKNQISEITRVSLLFNNFITEHQIPRNIGNALDLALDEILNNIINYGFENETDHKIEISINLLDDQFIVTVEDDGRKFNPLDVPEADTESSIGERPVGGLGIHLVRNLMDDVYYRFENNKNCITLKKIIRG